MIKVADVKIGSPSKPRKWSNDFQKFVETDYKKAFIATIKNRAPEMVLEFVEDTLVSDAPHYHTNYLNYLEKCWADHLGIVITPDIIWYTIISEFSLLVKKDIEGYRSLFTDSPEKKEILIPSGSLTVMPLDRLAATLKDTVPSDTSVFFPEFQSFTINTDYALLASFCDICSPYYNYSMYLCGFPFIDVRGTVDDWKILREQFLRLKKIIKDELWVSRVCNVLSSILARFKDEEWWKGIFKLKKCGSGHQTEVSGWLTDLFIEPPKVRYAENFSSHISQVRYKQLDTGKDFQMSVGLFCSSLTGECLEPRFSTIIHEIVVCPTEYINFKKIN